MSGLLRLTVSAGAPGDLHAPSAPRVACECRRALAPGAPATMCVLHSGPRDTRSSSSLVIIHAPSVAGQTAAPVLLTYQGPRRPPSAWAGRPSQARNPCAPSTLPIPPPQAYRTATSSALVHPRRSPAQLPLTRCLPRASAAACQMSAERGTQARWRTPPGQPPHGNDLQCGWLPRVHRMPTSLASTCHPVGAPRPSQGWRRCCERRGGERDEPARGYRSQVFQPGSLML